MVMQGGSQMLSPEIKDKPQKTGERRREPSLPKEHEKREMKWSDLRWCKWKDDAWRRWIWMRRVTTRKEKGRRSNGRESLTPPNSKKRAKLLVAQGFREIDRRFITAPSLLTIWVLSISLMQLKPHLKNKHNMDLAMSSPSKHLGLYRYNFNIQRNKNLATLYLSGSTVQRVW